MGQFLIERYPFEHEIKNAALYNTSLYLKQNSAEGLIRVHWMEDGVPLISCNLYERDNRIRNAEFSSFGGIEFTNRGSYHLSNFSKSLMNYCVQNGLSSIILKLPSIAYQSDLLHLQEVLLSQGFTKKYTDVSQHIKISSERFLKIIKKNERKKLRQCTERDFRFKKLSILELPEAYDLILDSRVRNNFPVSMRASDLRNMFKVFEDHYHLFGVYDGEKLIATAVSIQVCEQVLYNFYHGDLYEYRSLSPTVMLLEGVYRYCQNNDFTTLDLGVSSVKGVLNQGLFDFKKNCGCSATEKVTMELVF